MTSINPRLASFYQDVEERFGPDAVREVKEEDDVSINIVYHRFVSRSKGWRNGRRRIRGGVKEVRLIKYGQKFTSWHRFPFDEAATEIMGQQADGEALKERIDQIWGY